MSRFHPAAFALAHDGTLLLNLATVVDSGQLADLVAAAGDAPIFIGVPVAASARRLVLARLDDAAHEAAALIAGATLPPKARKKRAPKR